MVSTSDLHAALALAEAAAAVGSTDDVVTLLLPALCRLLDCPGAIVHEMDQTTGVQHDVYWPPGLGDPAAADCYARVRSRHPFVRLAASGEPVVGTRVSDLMTARAWRSSEVYTDAMQRVAAQDQMSTTLTRRGAVSDAVSLLTDGRPFTDRQRDLLLLARPHVAAALRRTHSPGATHRMLVLGSPSHWVDVACGSRPPARQQGPPLTEAEHRVLTAAADGLTSTQIARRVGCAPRTVEKHLEHAYLKLGVSNRVAALHALGLPRQRVHPPAPGLPPGCRLAD